MIESFKNAFSALLKNPFVLIPALFSAVVAFYLTDLVSWPMLEMLYEFAIVYNGMQLGFFEMIVMLYKLYASNLLFFSAVSFASMIMLTVLLFFYSKYAMHYTEKGVFSSSLKYALERVPRAISLAIFLALSVFLAALILFATIIFVPMVFMLNAILFVILAVIFIVVFLRLFIFAVPAMVLDDLGVRDGISRSWNFTEKKLPETILVIIIAFFTTTVITQLGVFLLNSLQEGILPLIVAAIFNSFVFAFGSLFFALYYFNNCSEAGRKAVHRKKKR